MNPTESASVRPVFGPATAVLALAVSGRWRAPETTAALAHQAAMQARSESDISTALLAEGWLLHGLLAVGRGATGVARAVEALEDASRSGNAAAEARLRVGLASVARELGDVNSASALLAPVIERDIIDPELAVDAYLEAIRCGGYPVAGGAHAAVDLVVGHIRTLRGEQVELGLAALDAALAAQHRAGGRNAAAVARAREGLRRLLGESAAGSELDPISPHLAATLSLELTRALLDDGQPELACRVAEPALAWAGRAAALVPLTRLRLALAERAYLPAGQYDAALGAVGWAADVVGEHDLPELEADCQNLLADVHERRGALPAALAASRRAHAALRTHSARVEQALVLLGRCAARASARSDVEPGAWDQEGYGPRRFDQGRAAGAWSARSSQETGGRGQRRGEVTRVPGSQGAGQVSDLSGQWGAANSGQARLEASADNATVRLRAVKREPTSGDSWEQPMPGAAGAALTAAGAGDAWSHESGFGRSGWESAATADPGSHDARRDMAERHPYGGDQNARPAAAMASSSLDDWAAVTGWPGEPSTDSGSGDTYGLRAVRTEFQRPEGIGAIRATGERGLPVRGEATSVSGAFAPVERIRPEPTFDVADRVGSGSDPEQPFSGVSSDGDAAVGVAAVGAPEIDDDGPAPTESDGPVGDELGELFDPDERRPLGLVAIDVVTPRGPLTGYVVKPLLGHIADQARSQLPPNAGLQVLSSDMVLVVLPPVDADVVLRWMRSLATRLSASWQEYAADVPRSAYRVAVGAFDGQLSVHDNVDHLRARLAGVSQQPASPGSPVGGGRHVARGGASPYDSSPHAARTSAEPGTGGRRRRRDGGDGSVDANPLGPPARTSATNGAINGGTNHATGGSSTGVEATSSMSGERTPTSGGLDTEAPGRPYSRGRGIDRVALARLTQMAWRPTTPLTERVGEAEALVDPDGQVAAGAASESLNGAVGAGVVKGSARNGLAQPSPVGDPLAGDGSLGNAAPGNGAGLNRPSWTGLEETGAAGNGSAGHHERATFEDDAPPRENGRRRNGDRAVLADRSVLPDGPVSPAEPVLPPVNGVTAPATPDEAKDEPQGRSRTSAVTELSFAELLAGALAAYRDG